MKNIHLAVFVQLRHVTSDECHAYIFLSRQNRVCI